ncbi:hypothetical protein M231_00383 [Tremella mesenterica]|uniref:Uncharacterized protein n=1 Tax=Tremella mesenterica TaxID=5217 RepID=A0A4Q1BW58_TREME|nr:hypothetical protein M231_00383 [Tremella mesenterica]
MIVDTTSTISGSPTLTETSSRWNDPYKKPSSVNVERLSQRLTSMSQGIDLLSLIPSQLSDPILVLAVSLCRDPRSAFLNLDGMPPLRNIRKVEDYCGSAETEGATSCTSSLSFTPTTKLENDCEPTATGWWKGADIVRTFDPETQIPITIRTYHPDTHRLLFSQIIHPKNNMVTIEWTSPVFRPGLTEKNSAGEVSEISMTFFCLGNSMVRCEMTSGQPAWTIFKYLHRSQPGKLPETSLWLENPEEGSWKTYEASLENAQATVTVNINDVEVSFKKFTFAQLATEKPLVETNVGSERGKGRKKSLIQPPIKRWLRILSGVISNTSGNWST